MAIRTVMATPSRTMRDFPEFPEKRHKSLDSRNTGRKIWVF